MEKTGLTFFVGALVAASLSVTACGPLGLSGSGESASTTEQAGSDDSGGSDDSAAPEVAPPTTPITAPTQSTVPATKVGSTTSPPTTEPVDPCAEFEALLGYERMMAVKDGNAPTDPACKAAVDRSALALNTYETGLAFSEKFANLDFDAFGKLNCREGLTLRNVFDVPIMFWGVTTNTRNDAVVTYEPFISAVAAPGESVTVPVPLHRNIRADDGCGARLEAIVAPVGGLALGIDGPPAPANDPLASDDPQVWGPALLNSEADVKGIADLVNRVEDVHSNDVGNHLRELASPSTTVPTTGPATTAPAGPDTVSICGAEPADLGADAVGEFVWLRYARQWDDGGRHAIGLFSRGTDRRWRFLGTVVTVDEEVDPADPCKFPPLSTG